MYILVRIDGHYAGLSIIICGHELYASLIEQQTCIDYTRLSSFKFFAVSVIWKYTTHHNSDSLVSVPSTFKHANQMLIINSLKKSEFSTQLYSFLICNMLRNYSANV